MKRVLLTIFDPPWWFLLLGWPLLGFATLYYAWPASMEHYVEAAPTPQAELAIYREIKGAERRVALEFAAGTLRRISVMVQDKSGREDINKALEEIHSKIEQGYLPPHPKAKSAGPEAAAKPSATEPAAKSSGAEPKATSPAADDQSGAQAKSAAGTPPKSGKGSRKSSRKPKPDDDSDDEGYGIQVNPKGDVHINLGLVDDVLGTELEVKYGSAPLPDLDMLYKQRIYGEVLERVHNAVTGLLFLIFLVLSWPFFFISKIVASIIRAFSSRAEQSRKVAEQNSLARQLTEARLAAMQAQIEPHFLFNTMASVQQLIETDPPAAARMQANLIKYLRGAVPQMRESTSTLAREVELSSAYLDILKIRMEQRLRYRIELPPALGTVRFPPMMLPTVVENAIKHGLEPRTEGGEISIVAAQANGKLRVSVADTGMGFADQPGKGVGLTNIRERLVAMYGKQAQLIVEPNQPRGAKVTIEIPYAGKQT
jgi:histidine kinase/histidine kinase/DNA gyrase B/HSP90-like ATPase